MWTRSTANGSDISLERVKPRWPSRAAPLKAASTFRGRCSCANRSWRPWLTTRRPTTRVRCSQCDQIGQFLKVLGGKFTFKSYPNVWRLKGLLSNNWCGYLWGNFRKNLGYSLFLHLVTLNIRHLFVTIRGQFVLLMQTKVLITFSSRNIFIILHCQVRKVYLICTTIV